MYYLPCELMTIVLSYLDRKEREAVNLLSIICHGISYTNVIDNFNPKLEYTIDRHIEKMSKCYGKHEDITYYDRMKEVHEYIVKNFQLSSYVCSMLRSYYDKPPFMNTRYSDSCRFLLSYMDPGDMLIVCDKFKQYFYKYCSSHTTYINNKELTLYELGCKYDYEQYYDKRRSDMHHVMNCFFPSRIKLLRMRCYDPTYSYIM